MSDIQQIILDELRSFREETREQHGRHDERIRNVEGWQKNAEGKATMLASVSAAIGGCIAWLVSVFHK